MAVSKPDAEGGGDNIRRVGCNAFADTSLENLYQSYRAKQKRLGLITYLMAVLLFELYAAAAAVTIHASVGAFFIGLSYLVVGVLIKYLKCPRILAVVAWTLSILGFSIHVILKADGRLVVAWPLLIIYLVFVTLPLRWPVCLILGILTIVDYGVIVELFDRDNSETAQEKVYNYLELIAALAFGIVGFLLDDRQHRNAFLETRQSLEVKLVIEEQSAEQERLLLSVLPEHVAVKMRQDLGSTDTQFKKIYMSRHENVSILYADIVGFTAISSTYSAQDLVAILNELFARFDKLAEKYNQLRIKILGDCYYCISGAPVERPDHAVLSVHMGLSMVKSIKYLQQTTNSPVDMRVGIHTGAVLAGVLGQRQWQFDVYSRDVELANKMESSGMAGRVHISEKTLSFLNGEFDVEPAFGEKREEALRLAGIKTYFITKVNKPFQAATSHNGARDSTAVDCKTDGTTVLPDAPSDSKDEVDSVKSPVDEEKTGPGREREDSEDFNRRLKKELFSKTGYSELAKQTGAMLNFGDASLERLYRERGGCGCADTEPTAPLWPAMLLVAIILAPTLPFSKVYAFMPLVVLLILPYLMQRFGRWKPISYLEAKLGGSLIPRFLTILLIVIIFAVNSVMHLKECVEHSDIFTDSSVLYETVCSHNRNSTCSSPSATCFGGTWCSFRASALATLGAAAGAMSPLPLLARIVLELIAASPIAVVAAWCEASALDCRDQVLENLDFEVWLPTKYLLVILITVIVLALAVFARYMEWTSRFLFLWMRKIEEQREKAADMRRRNEALVYNVLPPHVAVHFMGNKRRTNELYSQSYAEVGVLFASMPNFTEFYSEETVNNQGLECLRFLNEVISDFDALLEQPKYQDIIKIKTIGSSYMAASGLNPSKKYTADDPISVRWSHLSLLVEFASDLKKALQSINEQSFNHFVLKMGINHGPITAGVIGVGKPHYDIWGNTVNVASRMESTGKAGCIQVTEETSQILQCFGYKFEQRGLVSVKGKGQLMTYYLQGKGEEPPPIMSNSPHGQAIMDTLKEEDESSPTSESKTTPTLPLRSPNGSSKVQNCNGTLPVSPSSVRSSQGPTGDEDTKSRLLQPNDEVNHDAKESDALLKH